MRIVAQILDGDIVGLSTVSWTAEIAPSAGDVLSFHSDDRVVRASIQTREFIIDVTTREARRVILKCELIPNPD